MTLNFVYQLTHLFSLCFCITMTSKLLYELNLVVYIFKQAMFFSLKFLGKRYISYLKAKTNIITAYSVATFKCQMIKIPKFLSCQSAIIFSDELMRRFVSQMTHFHWWWVLLEKLCTNFKLSYLWMNLLNTFKLSLWMRSFLKSFCNFSEKIRIEFMLIKLCILNLFIF